MTSRSSVNSNLMRRPRAMGVLSTLLLPCIQVRKLRRSRRARDHHSSWSCAGIAELEQQQQHDSNLSASVGDEKQGRQGEASDEATELSAFSEKETRPPPAAATTITQTTSIRLVSCADSECSTLGPDDAPILEEEEERDMDLAVAKSPDLLSDEETDVEQSSPVLVQKVIAMEVVSSRPPSRAGGGGGENCFLAAAAVKAKAQSKDDLDLELASRRIPRNSDRRPRPASMEVQTTGALKLPEIKSRIIEDIPEGVEDDEGRQDDGVNVRPLKQAVASKRATLKAETAVEGEEDDNTNKNQKRSSTWRLSQRKSMVELFNLLQSTAAAVAAAPKLSNLKVPLAPKSSPYRSSTTAVVDSPSSVYSRPCSSAPPPPTTPRKRTKLPSPPPPTPPPKSPNQIIRRPLPQTPQRKHNSVQYPAEHVSTTPSSPSPSPTKKQRRMGTVLFPLGSLHHSGTGAGAPTSPHHPHPPSHSHSHPQSQSHIHSPNNAQTLFC
ncbi:uncharacterized protein BO97DRAFT_451443 [Aspergillus homomorphus CBS 101889]|uniref:Uncharacterized protein n=1 Tax=Aspergillus homomorphus (strain CBS 101889) TaxID=1450537 RepID=A0A395HZ68_ASPHC|nr:hypothetical protein BO97DRAFT_451443 [Aspergillus homomorphus CBS 101889]RAL12765.1 hypothetical protein BO97DRAFT_451443 [Aspergillus homomorphus CBS 101889]